MIPLTPSDLLTPTGTPVTRTAGWWRAMSEDCQSAVWASWLVPGKRERIFCALDKIDNACQGRGHDELLTVIFTAREYRVLAEGDWLREVRE